MNYHAAYGLTVRTPFELPELPAVNPHSGQVDVEFRFGDVASVPESDGTSNGRRIAASPGDVRLSYDELGSFLVESGERVLCDPRSTAVVEGETFRRVLENEILGLILHQRDYLVLHASAVSVDGKAAVFLGPRGAGKSTTATAFHRTGYPMLEDDVVGIRFDGPEPTVVPGVPQLRLRDDAADALGVTDASTPSSEASYDKRYLPVEGVPDPATLAGCYVLREGETVSLEPLSGHKKILELIARTHARGLLSDTDQSPVHFSHCSTVVETARFCVLKRPNDLGRLPDLVETVATDLLSEQPNG